MLDIIEQAFNELTPVFPQIKNFDYVKEGEFKPFILDNLPRAIDHTLLRPDVTSSEVIEHCNDALKFDVFSVCVNTSQLKVVKNHLKGSEQKVCVVIDFPFGQSSSELRNQQTQWALENGADEIDIVACHTYLKNKDYEGYLQDLQKVCEGAIEFSTKKQFNHPVIKVIIETSLLSNLEIAIASLLVRISGADYVKTSSGFIGEGAKLDHVRLMRRCVGLHLGVKASGGIRDRETALQFLDNGASRIGTSSTAKILS
ncbi:MAG: deoxyribose-phosphate aldolase [Halobacteriovoraceae bacterium]|nr:deoxyribose-phosphate aldolase [Halobacteriovoraceae bacterium]